MWYHLEQFQLLVLHEMFRTRMDHHIEIPTSHIYIFKLGAGICTVPTADAVATVEVSCYNFIV